MRTDTRSDEQLVRAALQGDTTAMSSLYQRHRDYVYRLAWRFCANQQDAEDVAQQVFATLFAKPPQELTCQLSTYLYPLVRHRAIDLKRKQQRRHPVDPAQLDQQPATTSSPDRDSIHDLVVQLSPEHRDVVLLRFQHNLPLAAIAQRTGVPLGTVKSRLHHALRLLRRQV